MLKIRQFILITLLCCSFPGLAIRHDVEEAKYVELGQKFDAVCHIAGLGSGTLVADRWVLTAAHVAEMVTAMRPGQKLEVRFGGTAYQVRRVETPPGREQEPELHDIALLELETPVEKVTPLNLFEEEDELDREFVLAGFGILARGDKGVKLSRELMSATTRALRAGRNKVHEVNEESNLLVARFDPAETGTPLEAGPCVGDSGGPALIEVKEAGVSNWHIAGVTAQINDADEDRIVGEYGETFGMTRVSAYASWIYEIIE